MAVTRYDAQDRTGHTRAAADLASRGLYGRPVVVA